MLSLHRLMLSVAVVVCLAPPAAAQESEIYTLADEADEVGSLIEQLRGASLRKRIVSYERYVRDHPDSPYAASLFEEASLLRKVIELPPRPMRPSEARAELSLTGDDDQPVETKLKAVDIDAPTKPVAPDAAQTPSSGTHVHDGAFVRFGFGQAAYLGRYEGFVESNATPTNLHMTGVQLSTELLAGGAPARGFNIGGRLAAVVVTDLSLTEEGSEQTSEIEPYVTAQVGGFFDWYPDPTMGFHLLGSVYYTAATLSRESDPLAGEDLHGVGWTAGVGIEGFVADEWSLGVLFRVDGAHLSSESDAAPGEDIEQTVYAPGAQLTLTFN